MWGTFKKKGKEFPLCLYIGYTLQYHHYPFLSHNYSKIETPQRNHIKHITRQDIGRELEHGSSLII